FLLSVLRLYVLSAILGETRHWHRRRESRQVERVRCNQVERGPSRHFPRAERIHRGIIWTASPGHIKLGRLCQTDIVVLVLANPVKQDRKSTRLNSSHE